jgi:hypothetical protein
MKSLSPQGKFYYAGIIVFLTFLQALSYNSPAQDQNYTGIQVETWIYLEGAVINEGGQGNYALPMRNDLNAMRFLPGQCFADLTFNHYTPAGQPYNRAPWFYYGDEGNIYDSQGDPEQGFAGYPETVVDWVLVSLRSSADGADLCRKAALLHRDGHVEFDAPFSCSELGEYSEFFIVIEHRNHLIVMSNSPVNVVNGSIRYDFRSHQSYINDPFNYGAVGQFELPGYPGTYAMYSGNSDQARTQNEMPGDRTQVNNNDRTIWDVSNGSIANLCCGDINMNCDCNYNDLTILEVNNGLFTSVPVE